jgi:hypothetical protein
LYAASCGICKKARADEAVIRGVKWDKRATSGKGRGWAGKRGK